MSLTCDFAQLSFSVSLLLPAFGYQLIYYLCIAAVPLIISEVWDNSFNNSSRKRCWHPAVAVAVTAAADLRNRHTKQFTSFLIENSPLSFASPASRAYFPFTVAVIALHFFSAAYVFPILPVGRVYPFCCRCPYRGFAIRVLDLSGCGLGADKASASAMRAFGFTGRRSRIISVCELHQHR